MSDASGVAPSLSDIDAAQRHRLVSGGFAAVAGQVTDWAAPTPVPDWAARDVVAHLIGWFTDFLAAGGISVATGESVADDPVAGWRAHADAVQGLFDDPDAPFAHPRVGEHHIADAIDRFYTADVFMHTWDLARSAGVAPVLDAGYATQLRAGMEPIEEILRTSGQYGPPIPVADEADPVTRLMAFVGRDPQWQNPVRG